jgi:hypothetical protein
MHEIGKHELDRVESDRNARAMLLALRNALQDFKQRRPRLRRERLTVRAQQRFNSVESAFARVFVRRADRVLVRRDQARLQRRIARGKPRVDRLGKQSERVRAQQRILVIQILQQNRKRSFPHGSELVHMRHDCISRSIEIKHRDEHSLVRRRVERIDVEQHVGAALLCGLEIRFKNRKRCRGNYGKELVHRSMKIANDIGVQIRGCRVDIRRRFRLATRAKRVVQSRRELENARPARRIEQRVKLNAEQEEHTRDRRILRNEHRRKLERRNILRANGKRVVAKRVEKRFVNGELALACEHDHVTVQREDQLHKVSTNRKRRQKTV